MRRILFVDDDFAVAEVARMVLEHEGFSVTVASNGEDALAEMRASRYDLVITDYMMPIMNGAEMVRRMRTLPGAERLPVIVITTASPLETGDHEVYASQLPKPVTIDDLLATIARVLDAPT